MTMRTILDGLAFGEGPRWHDGELYVSDMHSHQVVAVAPGGAPRVVCRVEQRPSGLGWLPDGRMLVVSMVDRRVLRLEPDGTLAVHAELGHLAPWHCNDMVVSAQGRAYVGNFGFDLDGRAPVRSTNLIAVEPDGTVREVADDLQFPNGMVITPDGTTLIVGESWGGRLVAFTIGADGSLHNRRLFAQLSGAVPDGICLDAQGAVWVACPLSNRVLRVAEGGTVLAEHDLGRGTYACMLGGADRRTLFVCTANGSDPEGCAADPTGTVVAIDVDVPGAGLP